MDKFYKGIFFVVVSAICFALMPIFAEYAYKGGINVITLLFIRFSLAALILFVYIFVRVKKIGLSRYNLIVLFILGGVCYTLQSTCYFNSIKYISASLSALILYMYPMIVAVMSLFIDKEKLTIPVIFSIILSLSGLVLTMGFTPERINMPGVLLALAASLIYSTYIIIGNRAAKNLPSITISAFVALFAALCFLSAGAFTKSLKFDFSVQSWIPVLCLVVFSTIIAIFTFFKGLELLGSTKASIFSITEPLFVVVFYFIFFKDSLSLLQALGAAAILSGAVIVIVFREKAGRHVNISPDL